MKFIHFNIDILLFLFFLNLDAEVVLITIAAGKFECLFLIVKIDILTNNKLPVVLTQKGFFNSVANNLTASNALGPCMKLSIPASKYYKYPPILF